MSLTPGITDEQVVQAYMQEKVQSLIPDAIILPVPAGTKESIIMRDAKDTHKSMRVVFSGTAQNADHVEQQIEVIMDNLMPVLGDRVIVSQKKAEAPKAFPSDFTLEAQVNDTPAILKRRAQERDPEIYRQALQKLKEMQK